MIKTYLSFLLLFGLLACSQHPTRFPQSEAYLPDAHELFLVGKFGIKRPRLKPWYENHYGREDACPQL